MSRDFQNVNNERMAFIKFVDSLKTYSIIKLNVGIKVYILHNFQKGNLKVYKSVA